MTVKELRDAMKGLKGDAYVEVVIPAQSGGRWLLSIQRVQKKDGKFQIKVNNPI